MDALDLFRHLHLFDTGNLSAGQLWNYLSERALVAESDLDERALDVFDTAELVMAEYTSGDISGDEARIRLRSLLSAYPEDSAAAS